MFTKKFAVAEFSTAVCSMTGGDNLFSPIAQFVAAWGARGVGAGWKYKAFLCGKEGSGLIRDLYLEGKEVIF